MFWFLEIVLSIIWLEWLLKPSMIIPANELSVTRLFRIVFPVVIDSESTIPMPVEEISFTVLLSTMLLAALLTRILLALLETVLPDIILLLDKLTRFPAIAFF